MHTYALVMLAAPLTAFIVAIAFVLPRNDEWNAAVGIIYLLALATLIGQTVAVIGPIARSSALPF